MRALWFANIINLVLDPCFIFGLGPFPELGVTGSAIATTIGRGMGVLYQFYMLSSGKGRIQVRLDQARVEFPGDAAFASRIGGRNVSISGCDGKLARTYAIVTKFGDAAIAGYTIAIRIIIFALLPSWGMSNAAATLVGQNLGAGKPERAERSVWVTGFTNMVFLGGVTVVFTVFAEPIDSHLHAGRSGSALWHGRAAVHQLRLHLLCLRDGDGCGIQRRGRYDNADVHQPVCYWLFQIPLAYTLARHTGLGARGIFIAITIAETTIAVVGMLAFRRGRWKTRKI